MKRLLMVLAASCCLVFGATALGATKDSKAEKSAPSSHTPPPKAQQSVTEGSVTVEGKRIDYTATAGTIILKNKKGEPTGSMFYVAYAKRGADKSKRPVTFFYNGGPGSSSVWLHMGAFGPRRVVTSDHTHTPAAPYKLVNNDYSLLDVTDEVFIDAMGTGYSRVIGKKQGGVGEDKDFYGVDADAQSFAQFINQYLSQNNRWNSPKYIYGESYGTTRSALLARVLQGWDIDLNGVVLQSSILDFRTASFNAGNDLAYELFLPSYAAVAWYHHKLANQPADLQPFLQQVQQFAVGPYAHALAQGSTLSKDQFDAIAKKVSDYTGLSMAYVEKANLRVTASEFEHELLNANDTTVGRLDARFSGPSMDPMNQTPQYDPAGSIMPAYIATFNGYVHNTLKFGRGHHYLPMAGHKWDWKHKNRTYGQTWPGLPNTAFDLASAMKHNPNLQVLVSSGYFDVATPYFATVYTMQHLPIPKSLDSHIHMKFYDSGHMIYAHAPALKKLHDNTAAFMRNTDNH
ncbi:MAG: S10 family peptidase [Rhodanobacteraceae bacterium]